jgi:hypothetical protein
MATKEEVLKIVLMTASLWPNLRIDDTAQTAEVWHALLHDLQAQDIRAAIAAYAVEPGREFAPPVGQVRRRVVEMTAGACVPVAEAAWHEVCQAGQSQRRNYCPEGLGLRLQVADQAQRGPGEYYRMLALIDRHEEACDICGWQLYETPWSHPIVEQVAKQLGWPRSLDDNEYNRHAFISAYTAAVNRATVQAAMPQARGPLLGAGERAKIGGGK